MNLAEQNLTKSYFSAIMALKFFRLHFFHPVFVCTTQFIAWQCIFDAHYLKMKDVMVLVGEAPEFFPPFPRISELCQKSSDFQIHFSLDFCWESISTWEIARFWTRFFIDTKFIVFFFELGV